MFKLYKKKDKGTKINDMAVEICIYKQIGHWEGTFSANDMVKLLADASRISNDANLRLHCPGGDVMDGIAIFNLLKNSGIKINEVIVDGMAASIAAIYTQYPGAKRVMCKNTRLMLHGVSGGTYGTKNELKEALIQMESFETDLIEIIATNCGKTPDEVRSLWFDGKDHWFTPEEALAVKLIDEIRDGSIKVEPQVTVVEDLFSFYNMAINSQNKIDMKIKLNPQMATVLNLSTSEELEYSVIEAAFVNVLGAKDAKILELSNALSAVNEKEKEQKAASFENSLKDDKKRFTEEQKTHFRAIFKNDPDLAIKTVELMPEYKALSKVPGEGENSVIPEKYKNFTFTQFQADMDASKVLQHLKDNNTEIYVALYKAEFGKEPTI